MLSNFIIMKYINNKNNMTSAGAVIIVHFYSQGSEINTETDFLPIKSCNNNKKKMHIDDPVFFLYFQK